MVADGYAKHLTNVRRRVGTHQQHLMPGIRKLYGRGTSD